MGRTSPGAVRVEVPPIAECELARAIAAVGDRWTLLILREALCGVQRFEQMHLDLGIPRAVLTSRLNALIELGVLELAPYKEAGMRARNGYVLTAPGRALIPALLALREWAQMHLPNGKSRLKLLTSDGKPVVVRMVREDKLSIIQPDDVRLRVD